MNSLALRRWQAAALGLLAAAIQIGWEALHGGIVTHHFMRNGSLPGLSNAWAVLILPLLAFWAARQVQQRGGRPAAALLGFALALLLGAAVSVAFRHGDEALTAGVFFSAVALGIALPGYRAECLLGWVLGMGWTFGPVIPLAFGAVVVGISALLHLIVWPKFSQALRRFLRRFSRRFPLR